MAAQTSAVGFFTAPAILFHARSEVSLKVPRIHAQLGDRINADGQSFARAIQQLTRRWRFTEIENRKRRIVGLGFVLVGAELYAFDDRLGETTEWRCSEDQERY